MRKKGRKKNIVVAVPRPMVNTIMRAVLEEKRGITFTSLPEMNPDGFEPSLEEMAEIVRQSGKSTRTKFIKNGGNYGIRTS